MSAMAIVQPRHESWRAPGVEQGASPSVGDVLERLDGVLSELGEVPLGALADADVVRLLDATTVASSRLTREMCRTAAEADRRRLGDSTGARHTHQWWAGRSRHTQADAARLTALGRALEGDLHARTARALADGELRVEQARVIVKAVEAIPDEVRTPDGEVRTVDPAVRSKARDHLLAAAAEHDAKALRRLGKRILDVVAPSWARRRKKQLLAAEEARAHAATELACSTTGLDGATAGSPSRRTSARCSDAICSPWPIPPATPQTTCTTRAAGGSHFAAGSARRSSSTSSATPPATPPDRRRQRHRRGDHDARATSRRSRHRAARRRHPHERRAGSAARVRGRDHPRRARIEVPAARPRAYGPALHQGAAPRPRSTRRRLHGQGLRDQRVRLPRPPRRSLVATRSAPTSPTAGSCAPATTAWPTTPARS